MTKLGGDASALDYPGDRPEEVAEADDSGTAGDEPAGADADGTGVDFAG
ncbi:MAG TPA: hypothetical protein VNB94_11295 [Mycobacteriales bacterium]|nr:hypothetical protein [Mycobacteriales bacterium]